MEKRKLILTRTAPVLTVTPEAAQTLLQAGNGDAALLYLHILLHEGALDAGLAATELHRSDRDIDKAAQRLCEMGLLSASEERRAAPRPARELSEAETRDVVRRSMEDPAFQELLDAVQSALGRILSTTDLKKLFAIYDELALPPEVIFLLVQHCKSETEARYGASRNVSFAYIEKEAYAWLDRELMTYELADQWLKQQEQRKSVLGRLQTRLGLGGRSLTATERQYLEDWLDLGYGEDAIAIAADRTCTNTGGLKWKYADSIIRSWHSMGLHTPEEIERGDKKPGGRSRSGASRAPVATAPTKDDDKTLEQIARLREKMKQG